MATASATIHPMLATPAANPNLEALKGIVGSTLWLEQLKAIGVTLALSCIATAVLGYAIKATIGLRPTADDEQSGLDITGHGERGYHPSEV